MAIKLGTLDISSFKVGSGDCTIYLGDTMIYSGDTPTPPTPTLQWVEFNNGDDISGLDIYGVSGNAYDLSTTFSYGNDYIYFLVERNLIYCYIDGTCYTNNYSTTDNVELVFSNLGCSDYYNCQYVTAESTIKLLIYQ